MHTTTTTPCRVYLHPAAVFGPISLRAIEHVTGRKAVIDDTGWKVQLIPRAAHAQQKQGGAA
ncbi:hypothetical protein [Halomonas elongata]|nr:hypothetical protein [Halomonas elongata]WBF17844.1 hypothetical protein LM502_17530 [Halomonas elongata]WPU46689.1 hypothetical protein SR933_15780 [Halomonas elongata DSM 2581]